MSPVPDEIPSQAVLSEVLRIRSLAAGYWTSWCLQAAASLDLFSTLDGGPLTAAELSARRNLCPETTGSLLEVLNLHGLLERDADGRFSNTPGAKAALVRGGTLDQTGNLAHNHTAQGLAPRFPDMFQPDFVPEKSGGVHEVGESLFHAAHSAALLKAPIVLPMLALEDGERVVDLGAGSGDYTFLMARERSDLTGTLVDHGAMAKGSEELARQYGLEDRVRVVDTDFTTGDFGDGYTLALVSHILHYVPAETSKTLLRRAFEALAPGGRVVVHDTLRGGKGPDSIQSELLNLNVYLRYRITVPTCAETVEWLLAAGFENPTTEAATIGPNTLITAFKP